MELTIAWNNRMTNLGDKFNVIFLKRIGCNFFEIIGLTNLVKKWVKNLVTQLSE